MIETNSKLGTMNTMENVRKRKSQNGKLENEKMKMGNELGNSWTQTFVEDILGALGTSGGRPKAHHGGSAVQNALYRALAT